MLDASAPNAQDVTNAALGVSLNFNPHSANGLATAIGLRSQHPSNLVSLDVIAQPKDELNDLTISVTPSLVTTTTSNCTTKTHQAARNRATDMLTGLHAQETIVSRVLPLN